MSYDFTCGTCGKTFPAGWEARDNHLRSTGHSAPTFECDTCSRYFGSEKARFQHMDAVNHFRWECNLCDETWPTEGMRQDHEHSEHNYCADCQRNFANYNNLKMHLNSRIHRGQQIQCPFCKACLATATGLVHHIESCGCPSAADMTRETIYKFIRSKDPQGAFTKNLIQGPDMTRYQANGRAYNHSRGGWECYFCHKLFKQLPHLNQHLNSPAHQESLYHCPNNACGKPFTTLAAIINHLESESCGFTRFENVQRSIKDIISSDKLIKF
ncbi:hypothetical protein K461DRAFT_97044 [Myriangium duriaei CBS 260.36]|uniref:C2H2-type domain-containing protein n=1 Tax=Myriangium duriaei CBS 260.36 TaxID=1168546 RepID=A0A9P4J6Z9_9PEZI|nr:hypothetical protein K461DRAFT_97044 [Myriangium duriaei CBS 260.36]